MAGANIYIGGYLYGPVTPAGSYIWTGGNTFEGTTTINALYVGQQSRVTGFLVVQNTSQISIFKVVPNNSGNPLVLPALLFGNVVPISTTPFIITLGEIFPITTGGSAITVNLPAATGSGRKLFFEKVDTGAGTAVITPHGADTIEGAATKTLVNQYDKIGIFDIASGVWGDLGTGGGI